MTGNLPFNFRISVEISDISAHAARNGSPKLLARRLRNGDDLSQDERAYLADHLEGKIKRPRHRPKSFATTAKKMEVAITVLVAEQLHPDWGREASVATIGAVYNVSRAYVFRALQLLTQDRDAESHFRFAEEVARTLSRGPLNEVEARLRLRRPTNG